jgi:hypothetical protein
MVMRIGSEKISAPPKARATPVAYSRLTAAAELPDEVVTTVLLKREGDRG